MAGPDNCNNYSIGTGRPLDIPKMGDLFSSLFGLNLTQREPGFQEWNPGFDR